VSDAEAKDRRWLDAAVRLATPAMGTTGPGPAVGAIVADPALNLMFGRAVTPPRGVGQAELLAIEDTQGTAAGHTLYVTLEPPRSSALQIAEAGLTRVVVGALDPDPANHEEGVKALRERKLEVVVLEQDGARRLIEGYAMRLGKNRPLVTMKVTVSRDGMVGNAQAGGAPPIGVEAQRFVDRERAASDAVLGGVARTEVEDSDLRPHLPGLDDRMPLRVVLSGKRPPDQTNPLFSDMEGGPLIVFTTPEQPLQMRSGINVVEVDGRRNHPDLRRVVALLAAGGINRLFVEAGARLAESFIAAELIDRLYVIDSAVTVGRFGVPAALLGRFHERIAAAKYAEVDRLMLGEDKVRVFERR
jgi:diaminohydroxyphosphoribosylaminopyrimidine deaminase/5-amino-6-(5-phosphoribosylamino)uracil reductase